MKKMIVALLTVVMICSLIVAVSAENPVPSVEPEKSPFIENILDEKGNIVEYTGNLNETGRYPIIKVTPYADKDTLPAENKEQLEAVYKQINEFDSAEAFLKNIGMYDKVAAALSSDKAMAISALFDLYMNDVAQEMLKEAGHLSIVFSIPDVKDDEELVLLHFNGTEWEIIPTVKNEVGVYFYFDGADYQAVTDAGLKDTVTSVFTSASPIVFVKQTKTEGEIKSPQTGDAESNALFLGVFAVSFFALLAVYALKARKEN